MNYQMLVLDLDGTLTNSEKKITPQTLEALLEIQENGKRVVLASGRPTQGVAPLARQLQLDKFGGFILSYNGARIINCKTQEIIYNRTLPQEVIKPAFEIANQFDVDIITYSDTNILSGIKSNQYTELESRINDMQVVHIDHFPEAIDFPVNKLLVTGEPAFIDQVEAAEKTRFRKYINIYKSEPFFLELVPSSVDKAYSLQKLLNSIGILTNEMICCGDGYNDVTMIESAGLGVAMANAQPAVLELADYVTKSNDEDGVLHVINEFLR